ncbi:glycosyl hydrolase family 28-related protein [Bradyrhizobium sp. CCBAU 11430]|uniref:glycosyl hydrolase family 28-related protein n=1 Tax=Bradyrhizobium sp. CCBAU 11430 TaxID=1630881 RepID=UPI0023052228|nr:glycosyl hydrolase family 28-related protein [Bradyrhizobium sp. CCBAU 11430]
MSRSARVIVAAFMSAWVVACEPATGAPSVFWASDPVRPDETVLVVGDGLAKVETVEITRVADQAERAAPPAQGVKVIPVQVSNESLKFTIPKDIAQGVYRITFGNDPAPILDLNAPTIYWPQGDLGASSSPGGWLRVFGRNISSGQGTMVRLKPAGGTGGEITLQPSAASVWDATFNLPANLAGGEYSVRLWNGHGDFSDWRDVGIWRLEEKPVWPDLTLNAKAFGAAADGVHDDTPALKSALLSLAQKGGGTLFLPRGYYRVADGLTLPAHTRLKGEGRALVRLIWPDFPVPPLALLDGSTEFAIEDITIVAFNHAHIISGGFSRAPRDEAAEPRNIALRNVTVRASMYRGHLTPDQTNDRLKAALKFSTGGPDTVRLTGKNLIVEDCDLYGSGRSLYLERPGSARVTGNKLYNGRWGWYSVSGADRVIFEDNDVIGGDLQSTGGGLNTLGKHEMFAQNIAFLHNRLRMMNGWDREAVTSDGPGGCYYGQVAGISSDRKTVTLPSPGTGVPQDVQRCIGAGFFVLGGRGIGQVRRIRSVEGQSIQLDNPLDVSTDGSSIISLTSLQRHYLIVGNELSDAGNGIQLFGSSVDHIIADNVSWRTWGILNRGLYYRAYQPTWYTQILSNRIAEGDTGRDSLIGTWGSQRLPNPAPLSLATIIRSNTLAEGAHIEVKGYAQHAPGVRDVIVENNQLAGRDGPVRIDEGAAGVLLRKNIGGEMAAEAARKPSTP